MKSIKFSAIGTVWRIDIDGALVNTQAKEVERKIKARIELFDATYSRFRDDSLVAQIAKAAGRYKFPDDAKPLFDIYRQLYDVTKGKVTPLIGGLMVEAGYDANYSLTPQSQLHTVPAWDDVCEYAHPWLTVKQPLVLDFGAAGKGYLVDIIGSLLDSEGVESYMIDAGGDILRKGTGTVKIGLEHPIRLDEVIGVAELGQGSICASSGSRRKWAGLHHIMDPATTHPVRSVVAVWAMANTAMAADIIATALFFTEPSDLKKSFTFEFCLVYEDFRFAQSEGFPATLYTNDATS